MKEKGTMYWRGKHCFFTAAGGQAKELVGQLPPLVYMLKEALENIIQLHTSLP